MPVLLSELTASSYNNNPPPQQSSKYTLFDDATNELLMYKDPTMGMNPSKLNTKLNYSKDYLDRNQNNYPPQVVKEFRDEPKRVVSFESVKESSDEFNNMKPTTKLSYNNFNSAGNVSPLQNAEDNDRNAYIPKAKENFSRLNQMGDPFYSGQTCIDTLSHVSNCPICKRYFSPDYRLYNIIIVMLIILFSVIIYFLYREEKSFNFRK